MCDHLAEPGLTGSLCDHLAESGLTGSLCDHLAEPGLTGSLCDYLAEPGLTGSSLSLIVIVKRREKVHHTIKLKSLLGKISDIVHLKYAR